MPTCFSNMFIRETGWRAGGAAGRGRARGHIPRRIQGSGPDPQAIVRAPCGLIRCQSGRRCSGEAGLRGIPSVKPPLIAFISPYPFGRAMTPPPVKARGLTPLDRRGGGGFLSLSDGHHCWSDRTFLKRNQGTNREGPESGIQQQLQGAEWLCLSLCTDPVALVKTRNFLL